MYVACTRAKSALIVSAVDEPYDGGAEPSRFIAELDVPVRALPPRPPAPMSGPGLVTALRAAAEAPAVPGSGGMPDPAVEQLRRAAIVRLAALAEIAGPGSAAPDAADRGRPVAGVLAAAAPGLWWGARPWTEPPPDRSPHLEPHPDTPDGTDGAEEHGGGERGGGGGRRGIGDRRVGREIGGGGHRGRDDDDERGGTKPDGSRHRRSVLDLSPSSVEALLRCPRRWFLEKRARAGRPPGSAAAVGSVVHAVADALATGQVAPDLASVAPLVDRIWAGIPFPARYQALAERARVDEMLRCLTDWHRTSGRRPAGSEVGFTMELDTPTGIVRITGSIDRIDLDSEGRLHLVDFKTGRTAATQAATDEHAQLGIYQLAVREGAAPLPSDAAGATASGAELVHLADRFADGRAKVRVQRALAAEGPTWVHDLIDEATALATGPEYPARPGSQCATCPFRPQCPAHAAPPGAIP